MFRPLRDRILVSPVHHAHSEVLTVISKDVPNCGIVRAIGPQVDQVEIGEAIRFGTTENYLTYPRVILEGEEYLVLSEKDICFVTEH